MGYPDIHKQSPHRWLDSRAARQAHAGDPAGLPGGRLRGPVRAGAQQRGETGEGAATAGGCPGWLRPKGIQGGHGLKHGGHTLDLRYIDSYFFLISDMVPLHFWGGAGFIDKTPTILSTILQSTVNYII